MYSQVIIMFLMFIIIHSLCLLLQRVPLSSLPPWFSSQAVANSRDYLYQQNNDQSFASFALFCDISGLVSCAVPCLCFILFIILLMIVGAIISHGSLTTFLPVFFGTASREDYADWNSYTHNTKCKLYFPFLKSVLVHSHTHTQMKMSIYLLSFVNIECCFKSR